IPAEIGERVALLVILFCHWRQGLEILERPDRCRINVMFGKKGSVGRDAGGDLVEQRQRRALGRCFRMPAENCLSWPREERLKYRKRLLTRFLPHCLGLLVPVSKARRAQRTLISALA